MVFHLKLHLKSIRFGQKTELGGNYFGKNLIRFSMHSKNDQQMK